MTSTCSSDVHAGGGMDGLERTLLYGYSGAGFLKLGLGLVGVCL